MDDPVHYRKLYREKEANKFMRTGGDKIDSTVWIPKLNQGLAVLNENKIRYALFGAPAMAAHDILVRPTKDVDVVVETDKNQASELLAKKTGWMHAHKIKPDEDAELVIDFSTQIFFEVWENKLYTVPMTEEAWKRVQPTAMGYAICKEDIVASKVGRFLQSGKRKDTDLNDIAATLLASKDLDYGYLANRLVEGERREKLETGTVWNLTWYFIRELPNYFEELKKLAKGEQKARSTLTDFVSNILSRLTAKEAEHRILDYCRKKTSTQPELQHEFFINDATAKLLLRKWEDAGAVQLKEGKIHFNSKKAKEYESKMPGEPTRFAKERVLKFLKLGYRNPDTLASLSECSKAYVYAIAKKAGIKLKE